MPSDRFEAGQTVGVSHLQADGKRVQFEGKIVNHVRHDAWLVEVPALGLLMTLDEKDLSDGK